MPEAVVLELENLRVSYGGAVAISNASLSIHEASVVALVGNNGAGKTTLLNAILGLVRPSAGTITAFGEDITRRPSAGIIEAGIALVPEGRHVVPTMTAMDNLRLGYRRSAGATVDDRLAFVTDLFPEIEPHLERYAGLLSGGQQQMVAIGRALMSSPRLLLLDEPGLGLAPNLVDRVFSTLAVLAKDGISVLVAEQLAHAVFEISDYAYVVGVGTIVASGPPAELRHSGALHDAYFARGRGAAKKESRLAAGAEQE
jgi:branched-chain amino acid transport system ATP-binding protein